MGSGPVITGREVPTRCLVRAACVRPPGSRPLVPQSLSLEDQIEGGESELRRLKAEESSLRRLAGARKDRLATAQFRIRKKHEDAEQHKRVVIEYVPRGTGSPAAAAPARQGPVFLRGRRVSPLPRPPSPGRWPWWALLQYLPPRRSRTCRGPGAVVGGEGQAGPGVYVAGPRAAPAPEGSRGRPPEPDASPAPPCCLPGAES